MSILNDALMTPPSTNADSGNWDDSGSLRGYTIQDGTNLVDVVIERDWEYDDRRCILLRCTLYYDHHTEFGEKETWYVGKVYAPDVDSIPAGVYGTYVRDCYPNNDWFVWSERHWQNNPTRTETMQEMAIRKTKRLVDGLNQKAAGNL